MRIIKTLVIAILLTTSVTSALAQQKNDLIGTWITTYEENGQKNHYTFEFKKEEGKIYCYIIYIEDDKGHKKAENSIALSKIIFKNGKGLGNYIFEHNKEEYEVIANLRLKNWDTLIVSYSQWGYSGKEIWKRVD